MLSEDEKKAIKLLEDIKNNSWTTKYIMSSDSKNADILLNLITKLQKENDEKDITIDIYKEKLNKIDEALNIKKGIAQPETVEIIKVLQSTLQDFINSNKLKNKQIDLMAEHIVSSAIVDDIVCAIKCDCKSDVLEDCNHEKMINCTKQYFETKSKKGE